MITVFGANWCPDCRRVRQFLSEQRVRYSFVDLEADEAAAARVMELNDGKRLIPTVLFDDGGHLTNPTNEEVANKIGLVHESDQTRYDLVVIGAGPAGLTTALYGARENLSVLVIDKSALGGQASVTERFDNYPGFPEGVTGAQLAERMVAQCARYGVEFLPAVSVLSVEGVDQGVIVHAANGEDIAAGAALIATGSTYRRTQLPGESELIGGGLHFCATCDGPFYRGSKELVVLGGGNAGLEEGLFLTQFTDHITVIEHGATLRGSRVLQDKVASHPKMTILTETSVESFNTKGAGVLSSVTLKAKDGTVTEHEADAVFVFIGLVPNSVWLDGSVNLDEQGFIVTDRNFETSIPRVFAAGDIRAGSTKQLAAAVGEGAAAAIQIRFALDEAFAAGGSTTTTVA